MNRRRKILLVEDDPNLSFIIKDNLLNHGYDVLHKEDGLEALEEVENGNYFDLCLLDVMLPNADGFQIAQKIRSKNHKTPIIFLTAKGLEEDRIKGFKLGADDYITKPFSLQELVLRMEAVLRRSSTNISKDGNTEKLGQYNFKPMELKLIDANEQIIKITKKEAALLNILLKNKNVAVTRQNILQEVWGDDDYFVGRSMDVYMSKLRKYFKEDPKVEIQTIHGVGFKLLVIE